MVMTEIQKRKHVKDTLHHSVGGPLPVGDVAFKTPLSDAFLNAGIYCYQCFFSIMTQSKIMDTSLSQSVSKILTAYWSKKTYFWPGARKTEMHSFPTMYIMGGCSFGGNGSK